jgi:hypothetical protein
MKEKPSDHVEYDEYDKMTDEESWPAASPERNLEGKGKPKWYDFLPWEKFVQYLPRLRYLRGSKARFTITTFDEINKVCQQIFECNKSFFRFRTQVDLLAHYIGTKILEQIYVVQRGEKKYPLSKLLEEQEEQFKIWDQMKTVKEIFQGFYEKKVEGFITEKEFDGHVERYISTFESSEDRVKMAMILDKMEDGDEYKKAKDRVRKNFQNKQLAIEKGIHTVK